jgi:hypothetical protein
MKRAGTGAPPLQLLTAISDSDAPYGNTQYYKETRFLSNFGLQPSIFTKNPVFEFPINQNAPARHEMTAIVIRITAIGYNKVMLRF